MPPGCESEELEADFVQRPGEGLFALLKEPLQSYDHRCGKFSFEVQCPNHGSTGAPRPRWERPELGRDPDVTPDQHCEEWGGYFGIARRSASMAF